MNVRTSVKETRMIRAIKRCGDEQGKEKEDRSHRSQNADEGFYCIGRDIKVRVTSVHSRNRPELVNLRSPCASIGLLLLLLSHGSRPNENERMNPPFGFFSFLGPKSTLETSRSSWPKWSHLRPSEVRFCRRITHAGDRALRDL